MKGYEVIQALKHHISKNDLIVSSNGNISREVYHFLSKPQMYLRGSMGLPIPVGLGLALANPDRTIIVITGDGNFLMGLGAAVSTAFYGPRNLKILILDNKQYFTTGGQKTVSSVIDYSKFAESLNIRYRCSKKTSQNEIDTNLSDLIKSDTFSIFHVIIEGAKMDLKNIPWHPEEITTRVMNFLAKGIHKSD